jgi:probable LLM family oxidoreductase
MAQPSSQSSLPSLQFGLDTFGDVTAVEGHKLPHAQVIRNVVNEAVLADELEIDFIGLGEHHRADFAISSPEIVLGAIAGRTRHIRLGTSVPVLSSDDPVRLFQRFSTLDAVSSGRAEIILGRGSFTESFPLFGYPLDQYEVLFEEKLDLFVNLIRNEVVNWRGSVRAPLTNQRVYPPIEVGHLRAWIGVGGTPQSVVRAAHYDLPMMLAIIGGQPQRFAPFIDLYKRAFAERGQPVQPVGVHSHGYIADTDAQAREELWADYRIMHDRIGAERGWPPMQMSDFVREIEHGSLYVGAPDTVARKIATTVKDLGLSRFHLKYSAGPLSHERMMRSIELYGRKVIPLVRDLVA